MEKRQVLINAIMSVVQTVAVGLIVFVLYRYLLKTIGVEQFGIWSLVVATTGVAQIANFGLSGSVVKFVAKYVARGENEIASQVIQTATLSTGFFLGLILITGYPFAKWILGWVVAVESLPLALEILPLAFIAFWLLMVMSVFQASLDGLQRIDLRSSLIIVGSIINLIFCYFLAPFYGLKGVAYARVIENSTVFLTSWVLLRKKLITLPIFPYKWVNPLFREMVSYGTNFQIIFVISMLHDPITKAFLSRFGGLSMVGYYEMASKMIWQLRGVLVSANQVLVPAIANMQEKVPEKIKSVYLTSYDLVFFLALPLYSLIVVCQPIISELWIGHYENMFIFFSILLSAAWLINTLIMPAFFANLGTGELFWNVFGVAIMGLLNVGLGFVLGMICGGNGVVYGWVISLILGSILIGISYHKKNNISLINLLPKASWVIILVCLAGTSASLILQSETFLNLKRVEINSMIAALYLLILFFPLWFHPLRKSISQWVIEEISR